MANNQLQRRRLTAWALGISLIVLLVATIVWSIATGQYAMTPDELLATIRRFVGIDRRRPSAASSRETMRCCYRCDCLVSCSGSLSGLRWQLPVC